jgi:hypothetical protein
VAGEPGLLGLPPLLGPAVPAHRRDLPFRQTAGTAARKPQALTVSRFPLVTV